MYTARRRAAPGTTPRPAAQPPRSTRSACQHTFALRWCRRLALKLVLHAALSLCEAGAELVALIKPQFEAGPGHVGKGGMVKNPEVLARVQADVTDFLEASGWTVQAKTESPIFGGAGQIEYLVHAQKSR